MSKTKININLEYNSTKMEAIEHYLAENTTTLEQEILLGIDKIYKQHVPLPVRQYLEKYSKEQMIEEEKEEKKTPKTRKKAIKEETEKQTSNENLEKINEGDALIEPTQ